MVFRIQRSKESDKDLESIFRHLIDSYLALGDDLVRAIEQAEARMHRINRSIDRIAEMPFQGTRSPHLGQDVRRVTKERAILYFEVSDTSRTVQLLAVFFGGQDHQKYIMERQLRSRSTDA